MMTEKDVIQLIKTYINHHQTDTEYSFDILDQSVRQDGDWWYVPVCFHQEIKKRYPFYEELSDIEEELKRNEDIDILLVPAL